MELTKQQIERQDFVDNSIFELLQHIKSSEEDIEWNIEMIADVREAIRYWIVDRYHDSDENTFYPFMDQ